jgi:hypothetical protein
LVTPWALGGGGGGFRIFWIFGFWKNQLHDVRHEVDPSFLLQTLLLPNLMLDPNMALTCRDGFLNRTFFEFSVIFPLL